MYTINEDKEQGNLVNTVQTTEYHLKTQEGLEFIVRLEDSWDSSNYYTNLSEDGASVDDFVRQLWDNEPLYDFFVDINWG